MTTLRRQGAWAVIDQVLSSGTNFVPVLLMARLLGPALFGASSLALLAWFGVLGVLRSALMTPYTLEASALDGAEWRDTTRHASGAVLVAGVISGGAFAITGVIAGPSSSVGQAFLAVAVLAPGLALQEFWRVASFAAQRARTAAANDFFWVIGQVIAFAFVLSRGSVDVSGALFAWGAGGCVAAALGVRQLSVVPRVGLATLRWARKGARIGAWFTATSATFVLGNLVVAIVVAASLGIASLGLFRAVQNLFQPVQLLRAGAESVFLPHLVRSIKRTATTGVRESWRYSLLMVGLVVVYGLILVIAAHAVLTTVFGAAFAPATVLVVPMLVALTLDAACSGAESLLIALAKGGRLLVAVASSTSARIVSVAVLVGVAGLRGAGWGLVIGSAVAAIVFWTQIELVKGKQGRQDLGEPRLSHHPQVAEAG